MSRKRKPTPAERRLVATAGAGTDGTIETPPSAEAAGEEPDEALVERLRRESPDAAEVEAIANKLLADADADVAAAAAGFGPAATRGVVAPELVTLERPVRNPDAVFLERADELVATFTGTPQLLIGDILDLAASPTRGPFKAKVVRIRARESARQVVVLEVLDDGPSARDNR